MLRVRMSVALLVCIGCGGAPVVDVTRHAAPMARSTPEPVADAAPLWRLVDLTDSPLRGERGSRSERMPPDLGRPCEGDSVRPGASALCVGHERARTVYLPERAMRAPVRLRSGDVLVTGGADCPRDVCGDAVLIAWDLTLDEPTPTDVLVRAEVPDAETTAGAMRPIVAANGDVIIPFSRGEAFFAWAGPVTGPFRTIALPSSTHRLAFADARHGLVTLEAPDTVLVTEDGTTFTPAHMADLYAGGRESTDQEPTCDAVGCTIAAVGWFHPDALPSDARSWDTSSPAVADDPCRLMPRVVVPTFDTSTRLAGRDFDRSGSTNNTLGIRAFVGTRPAARRRTAFTWGGIDDADAHFTQTVTTRVPARTPAEEARETHTIALHVPLQGHIAAVHTTRAFALVEDLIVRSDGRVTRVMERAFDHRLVLAIPGRDTLMLAHDRAGVGHIVRIDARGEVNSRDVVEPPEHEAQVTPAWLHDAPATAHVTASRVALHTRRATARYAFGASGLGACDGDGVPDASFLAYAVRREPSDASVLVTIAAYGDALCVSEMSEDAPSHGPGAVRSRRFGANTLPEHIARAGAIETRVAPEATEGVYRGARTSTPTRWTERTVSVSVDDAHLILVRAHARDRYDRLAGEPTLAAIDGDGRVIRIALPEGHGDEVPTIEGAHVRYRDAVYAIGPAAVTRLSRPDLGVVASIERGAIPPSVLVRAPDGPRLLANADAPDGDPLEMGETDITHVAGHVRAANGLVMVAAQDQIPTLWPPGAYTSERGATRTVLYVYDPLARLTRMLEGETWGDVRLAANATEVAVVDRELRVRVARPDGSVQTLGKPFEGTACGRELVAFALDPPRLVITDCPELRSEFVVRHLVFDGTAFRDTMTPLSLGPSWANGDETWYAHGAAAAFDGDDLVLARVRPPTIEIVRVVTGVPRRITSFVP